MKHTIKWVALLLSALLLFSMTGCTLVIEEEVVSTRVIEPSTSSTATTSTTTAATDKDGSTVTSDATGTQTKATTTTRKPAETRTEPKLSGKLELQIFTNESQTADGGWTNVINAFEDATGISVNAQIGSSVNTMMSKRWQKGDPPDMIWLDGSGIPDQQYEKAGSFYDLSKLFNDGYVYGTSDKIKDVVDNNLVQKNGGKIYRLPVLSTAGGMWYDARFMSNNGFAVPQNFDQLMALGAQAKAKGYSTMTYTGIYASYALSNVIAPAVAAYGQSYFNQFLSGSAAAVKDARFKKVMQKFADFCRTDGYLMEGSTTMDHTSTQQRWINHATLLIANGLWLPDETRKLWSQKSFDMAWTPSPLIDADQKQTVAISGKNVAVATKAKNLDNALAFVRFLYRDEAQNWLMYSYGYMGVRTDMEFDTDAFVKAAGGTDAAKATATALDYINSNKVNRVYWNESWGTLGDEIALEINELAMKGGKSVDEAIDRLASVAPKK